MLSNQSRYSSDVIEQWSCIVASLQQKPDYREYMLFFKKFIFLGNTVTKLDAYSGQAEKYVSPALVIISEYLFKGFLV